MASTSTNATASASTTADKGALPTLSWLEEDDEFEEFDGEDWNETEEDLEEISAWNDNWDNDELNDDFSKQLRAELAKAEQKQNAQQGSTAAGAQK